MPFVVDVEFAERYWYPDDGGQVWVAGYQLVDPCLRVLPRPRRAAARGARAARERRGGRAVPAARARLPRTLAGQPAHAPARAGQRARRQRDRRRRRRPARRLRPARAGRRARARARRRPPVVGGRAARAARLAARAAQRGDDAAGARGLDRAPRAAANVAPCRAAPDRPCSRSRPRHGSWASLCAAVGVALTTAARVPAARRRAGRLARRRLPAGGAARRRRVWGAWLGVADGGRAARSRSTSSTSRRPGASRSPTSENWVALVVFLIVAVIAQLGRGGRARARAGGRASAAARPTSRPRWRGCCCAATRSRRRCRAAAQRLAQALELPSAAIELQRRRGRRAQRRVPAARGRRASSARSSLPRGAPRGDAAPAAGARRARRSRRCWRRRSSASALLGEVVETARAAPQPTSIKTALLRAVSHDLRSPLTAILAAGEALALADADRRASARELAAVITEEAQRLSRLIDNLLDLSRLEAGAAEPRPRVVLGRGGARAPRSTTSRLPAGRSRSRSTADLPLVRADAAQLERAFANLLENARRHSGGHPVSVRARARRRRGSLVRVVDRGPGHPAGAARARSSSRSTARGDRATGHRGSGLGLAIARGFVEANGGTDLRSSRCPARARRSSSSSRSTSPVPPPTTRRRPRERPPARPRLRRRAADPARAARGPARRRLRGRSRRRPATEALDHAAVRPPRRGDRRPRAARTATASRSAAQLREWTADADHRALGRRRGGARRSARWRPAPTTT